MIHNLSAQNSIANQFIAELRAVGIQQDRLRFRKNLERLGSIFAVEISKELNYEAKDIETPLGIANSQLPSDPIVLATILRAGLPLHQGLLNFFDGAENAFVSAYRKHHKDGSFEIDIEYVSCPSISDKVLIIADPMLATGASMQLATKAILNNGMPKQLHFVTAIASTEGVDHIKRHFPKAHLWVGAIDEELTAKSYIVPGLGDAGDLAFGEKLQD
ncbi:MAG: uracil phosphoribosyltransferase [Saprospiraceae bacterium]